ncbi:hypothetical protein K435DRAFT_849233 [Dendrothele bispora CBS 962.96]|uniref:Uncharacterized protein n=1 Tax=Dendrothele bispora (strain CBS 962.96) TaxID=1314807 RepID=A0A4S8MSV5_DENBC|nr:hypothetical protein K435DRAFT_849233 [Dendrothele bispora CBS 962.96]
MSRHGAKRPDPHPARTSGPQTTFKFCPTTAFAEPAVTPDPSIVYSQTDFGTPVDISSFVEAKKQNVPDKRSWLSCYMKGYMHRDVSPLNIWKIDKGPRQRHPFSTRSVHSLLSTSSDGTHTSTGETSAGCADKSTSSSNRTGSLNDRFANLKVEEDTYWNDLHKALDDQRAAPTRASDKYMRQQDIVTMAMELEEVVRDLEITTDCKAALGNFEVAAEINASYFGPEMHDEEVGANPVFMSTPQKGHGNRFAILTVTAGRHAFVFLDSIVDRYVQQGETSEEEWEALIMGNTDKRDRAADGILYRGTFVEDYNLLLCDLSPLLKDWQRDLHEPLNDDWAVVWKSMKDREKHKPRLASTANPDLYI